MHKVSKLFILTLTLVFGYASLSHAMDLDQPSGPVILTVTGKIQAHNDGEKAVFDKNMLISLGMKAIKTNTPWHDKPVTFEGPPTKVFLDLLGVGDGMLHVRALNDYVAKVPVQDFLETGAILAMKADGKFMRVRDKGPLFIIYPYDDNSKLKNDVYFARSVWQIKAIHVE